jgi:branched-chain amino acid transport system substrate-binding protein
MDKYYPNGDKSDNSAVYGPSVGAATVQVLKQCDNDLTRENIIRQAANLHDVTLPMLQPGITLNTSPTEFVAIRSAWSGSTASASKRSARC